MRDDVPSLTAIAVALARGAATLGDPPAPDPVAAELVPWGLGPLLRGLRPLARLAPLGAVVRASSIGFVDHVALRTAAIDDAVRDAVAEGCEQVVLCGAGLDARAYRLHALHDATVYEVDHPATQRSKRARVEGLLPTARDVRFVPVDFARDRLDARLLDAGHDPTRPTAFVWEGVTMYLTEAATRATLESMRSVSAPGSRLAVTYGMAHDRVWLARFRGALLTSFRLLGEPLLGLTEGARFAALLTEAGWPPLSDTGPAEWSARYGFGSPRMLSIAERLVVAACAR